MSKDYKKLHEEALERAKIFKSPYCQHAAEVIFPELRESEDERIREAIIDTLNRVDQRIIETNYGIKHKDAVAWLEKQKEPELSEDLGEYITELSKQFPEVSFAKLSRIAVRVKNWLEKQGEQKTEIEYIYPKFRIGDIIEPIKPNGFYRPVRVLSIEKKTKSYYCESDDKKSFSSIPIRCENEYKLVEQKSVEWSEEDIEKMVKKRALSSGTTASEMTFYRQGIEDTIKSLKSQPHWKPSEEQMEALNWIAYNYALMDKGTEEKLQSLYNGLLKL